jgi:lysophospholipase L1-like esterase
VTQRPQGKKLLHFLFSAFIVLMFFGFLETVLYLSGFQPTIPFKKFAIPAWMEELDSLVLAKYQGFVVEQGFVNEDVYAYRPDRRYGYLLKPNLEITVSNYSSAAFIEKLPPWTIRSDSLGNRIPVSHSDSQEKALETQTLHVLGDSSSFGWGVNFEDSYSQRLVQKLEETVKDRSIVLKNYSTPGFTSFQGRLILEEKANIKKDDLVLVSFGSNDSYPSKNSDRWHFQTRNSMAGKISWSLNRLLLVNWLRTLIYSMPELTPVETKNRRVSLQDYQENLISIFETILQRGGKPQFINICNRDKYREAAVETAKALQVPFYNFPEIFDSYLSKVHDLYPEKFVTYFEAYGELIEKETQLVFLFPDLCHPNAIGHQLMADIVAAEGKIFN